jgi:hypothetical protein
MQRKALLASVGIAVIGVCAATVRGGDLNPPPGPIAPTDSTTINQQSIGSLPYAIGMPGTYKLTTNLVFSPGNGIEVFVDDVTIDLNGFELNGVGAPGSGIMAMNPVRGITIRDGVIRDWGQHGIDMQMATQCRIEDVTVLNNGQNGIYAFTAHVESCHAEANGANGIEVDSGSIVENCTSNLHGNGVGIIGVDGTVIYGCTAERNLDGILGTLGAVIEKCSSQYNLTTQILADVGSIVKHCRVRGDLFNQVGQDGIVLFEGSHAIDCTVLELQNFGIFMDFGCVVRTCTVRGAAIIGIVVLQESEVMDCHVSQCGFGAGGTAGIEAQGTGSRITGNDVKGAPTCYNIVGAGNTIYSNSATMFTVANYFAAPGNDLAPVSPAAAAPPGTVNITY